jgi:hypothetical protein
VASRTSSTTWPAIELHHATGREFADAVIDLVGEF